MSFRAGVMTVLAFGAALGLLLGINHRPGLWLIVAGECAVGMLFLMVERRRYRPVLSGSHFVPTAERYADPVSGQTIVVYVDQRTGQRDYRPEPGDCGPRIANRTPSR